MNEKTSLWEAASIAASSLKPTFHVSEHTASLDVWKALLHASARAGHCPHSTEEEAEAQREQVTCFGSHS